jgi:ATP-dependent helicase HrpB
LRAPRGFAALACDVAALVEARNPLRGTSARSDDFRLRVAALRAWQTRSRDAQADSSALATLAQAAQIWRRRLPARAAAQAGEDHGPLAVGNVLIHAFPDRIARQDATDPRRSQLANGRGARLLEESARFGEPWLVAVDLRYDERDSLILSAAPFDADLLERDFPERFARARNVRWNRDARMVEAFEEKRFDAIVLERRAVPPAAADAVPALLAAVRDLGLDALPWSDHARALRLRVAALRAWMPELGLPDFSDAALLASLEDWLAPYLTHTRRLDALKAAELSEALGARLDFAQRRALDDYAPLAVRVPSGLDRPIVYAADAPPVLAVKLQELCGLADTPRIANGRIALTLHLLSPGGRPIQVTQDLKSFWERTYPEVKKELKGRYPKHPWPDDPWTATPPHRAKPRR